MRKRHRIREVSLFLFFVFLLVSLVDSSFSHAYAQEASPTPTPLELLSVGPISVSYPIHGQTLKGSVAITGSIGLEGWSSFELAFSEADKINPAWFLFASATNPVPDGPLAAWDTTTLTDGVYNLRLRVFGPGEPQDVFIYGLRLRNYTVDTPVPTLTFTPTLTPLASPTATITLTFTPSPSATPYSTRMPLPPNPASLPTGEIIFNLARGTLFTTLLFGVFGLVLRWRSKRK